MKPKKRKLKYIAEGKTFLGELGKTVRKGEIVELENTDNLNRWEWEECTNEEFDKYNSVCPTCGRPYELKETKKKKIKKGEKIEKDYGTMESKESSN